MLDWMLREGGIVLSWWLLVTLAGAAALPLVVRLLGGLPDRGYTLARAVGLLLTGFTFWLLASLGFLRNSSGDMLLAWLIVIAVSLVVYLRAGEPLDWRAWWRENRAAVVVSEILFALLFVVWALYRAHQNGLTGTEKPMELMFMSSIQRSETFPPNDGWMAGYAVSYYYFGYVLSSMLSTLSGIHSTTGFNMTISLLFALTGLTSFGVVYNLVRARVQEAGRFVHDATQPRRTAILIGLLGMAFVVLLGNFELPLLELPYQTGAASQAYLDFWDVNARETPLFVAEGVERTLDPATWGSPGYWWWFRAARVLRDLSLENGHIEVIDEFPAFSFLLADNHPHVLALPFVLLALGTALNVLLRQRNPSTGEFAFYSLVVGGLGFLNTWDAPVALLALLGADALRRMFRHDRARLTRDDLIALAAFGVGLLAVGFLLYLPFWLGFRSQAGGVLPNVFNPTRTQQLFMMFGPFFVLLPLFLAVEARRADRRMNWRLGFGVALGLLLLLLLALVALVALGLILPAFRGSALSIVENAGGWDAVWPIIINRRLEALLTPVLLIAGIVLVVGRLFPRRSVGPAGEAAEDEPQKAALAYAPSTGFALLLVGIGLLLVLAPEFVYLRDNFGTRMNTIFKFYYQAWVLWSVAAAYGVYTFFADHQLPVPSAGVRAAAGAVTALALFLGFLFPVYGVYSRALVETGRIADPSPPPLTLDGGPSFVILDDYEAIICFDQLISGDDVVAVEAIGPAYRSEYGRVAALSGVPVLLGWENHEGQWRGATYAEAAGTRPQDIPRLYRDPRWETAQEIIQRYGIDYIFFGRSERDSYGTGGEDKFRENMDIVCQRGTSRFYRVRPVETAAR